jgi:hypothetical protein
MRPWGGFAALQLLLELEVEPVLGTTWREEEMRQLILEPVVLQNAPVYRSLLLLLHKSLTNSQILPDLLDVSGKLFIILSRAYLTRKWHSSRKSQKLQK